MNQSDLLSIIAEMLTVTAILFFFLILKESWGIIRKKPRIHEFLFYITIVLLSSVIGFSVGIKGGIMGWLENGLSYNPLYGLPTGFSFLFISIYYHIKLWQKKLFPVVN